MKIIILQKVKCITIFMKNKKIQLLESVFCYPLSVEFTYKTVRNRGHLLKYFHRFSLQSTQGKILHQNWMKNKNSRHLPNMQNFVLNPI